MFPRDRDQFRGNDNRDIGMEMDGDTGTTVARRRTGTRGKGASASRVGTATRSRTGGAKKSSTNGTHSRKRK